MKRIIFIALTIFSTVFVSISCGSTPQETKPAQTKVEQQKSDEEYERSVGQIAQGDTVSKEEFITDKTEIINIIKELQKIMDKQDYQGWVKHISKTSIQYYTSPVNIRKANKRLPDKTIVLNGLEDYFKYVFIPSRKASQVDEIRYVSKTAVKAVQVQEDGSIFVYYNFVKEDNEWKVKLPTV